MVVADAGIAPQRITFSPKADTNWHAILEEARRQEKLDALLERVKLDYGANRTFVAGSASVSSRGRRWPRSHPAAPGPVPPVPRPPTADPLIGRDAFLAELVAELTAPGRVDRHALTALRGLPGVGKTALAKALANEPAIVDAFPDGRAWVALGPDPAVFSLLGRLLEQFGASGSDLITPEARADRLRSVLAGRRYLLVLDDVWQPVDARPFLDAVYTPACAVLTTRFPRVAADLHAANHEVRVLKPEHAVAMLASAGDDAAAAVAADRPGAAALAEQVGRLPLALHVAGRRLDSLARAVGPRSAITRLAREVEQRLLALTAAGARLGIEGAEPSLEAVLALSYDALPDDRARQAFRRLAVFGGQPLDFDLAAMAAVWAADEDLAVDLLAALMDAGLVEVAGEDPSRRYALHQVIARFVDARLQADPAEAQAAALAHAQHYAGLADALNSANLETDAEHHLDDLAFVTQMDADFPQMQRAVAWTQDQNSPTAVSAMQRLVGSCRNYALAYRSLIREYQAWMDTALKVAEAGQDRAWAANTRLALGDLALRQADLAGAGAQYQAALADYQALGDRLGAANTRQALGDLALRQDDLAGAGAQYQAALADYQALGSRLGAANTRRSLGDLALRQDDLAGAGAQYQAALADYQAIGARLGAANTRQALGDLALRQDDLAGAGAQYQAALADYQAIGARLGAANTRQSLGDLALRQDDLAGAGAQYQAALADYQALGDRLGAANTRKSLGELALAAERSGGGRRTLIHRRSASTMRLATAWAKPKRWLSTSRLGSLLGDDPAAESAARTKPSQPPRRSTSATEHADALAEFGDTLVRLGQPRSCTSVPPSGRRPV